MSDIDILIKQITEGYEDYEDYEPDCDVDVTITLDLRDALRKIADNDGIAVALFNYFKEVCAELNKSKYGKYAYIHNDRYLVMSTFFNYRVVASCERSGTEDEVYDKFAEMIDDVFLYNKYIYAGKNNIHNSNKGEYVSRFRKGKFNVYPYVQELIDGVYNADFEIECIPDRDLDDIKQEDYADDVAMRDTYRDLYYFR